MFTKIKRALITSCNAHFADGAEGLLRGVKRCHPDIPCTCYVPPEELPALRVRLGPWARVEPFPFLVAGVPVQYRVNIGRLFVAACDAETAVYVDADVVFCRPAPELWDIGPGMVRAVPDTAHVVANNLSGENRCSFLKNYPEVAALKGANMGVFGLRPSEWRDLPQRFSDALIGGGFQYDYIIDQPLLNAIFYRHFKWLPFTYNAHCLFDNKIPHGVRLVHFTGGGAKPWQVGFPQHEPAYWFWLKYGKQECRMSRLTIAALRIALHAPKRFLGRKLKQLLG